MWIAITIAVLLFGTVFYLNNKKSEPYRTDYKPTLPENITKLEETFILLVNKHRQNKGLQQLKYDSLCFKVANDHCEYIVEQEEASHDNFPERVYELTLNNAKKVGEVVSFGYISPEGFFKGYLGSIEHKNILEHSEFTHIGTKIIGRYNVTILSKYEK